MLHFSQPALSAQDDPAYSSLPMLLPEKTSSMGKMLKNLSSYSYNDKMEKGIQLAPLSSDASPVLLYAFVLIHYPFQSQGPA